MAFKKIHFLYHSSFVLIIKMLVVPSLKDSDDSIQPLLPFSATEGELINCA